MSHLNLFMKKGKVCYKVGVLAGGISDERDISVKSGMSVFSALQKIYGSSVIFCNLKRITKREILKFGIDIAFLTLHGIGGEDGKIQKILESVGIEYTGSEPLPSKCSFNKFLTKKILLSKGILTPDYVYVTKSRCGRINYDKLKFPVFAKPVENGSSIGVKRFASQGKLSAELMDLVEFYGDYIIESEIKGKEITVGILGKRALPPIRLKPAAGFYDYEAKYFRKDTEYIVPADISAHLSRKLKRTALTVHRELGLRDFSRVDMILSEEGKPYVIEVNSIPGFTEKSLLPKAALSAGIGFEDLCKKILNFAVSRKKRM